jgi:hypothetical protein
VHIAGAILTKSETYEHSDIIAQRSAAEMYHYAHARLTKSYLGLSISVRSLFDGSIHSSFGRKYAAI